MPYYTHPVKGVLFLVYVVVVVVVFDGYGFVCLVDREHEDVAGVYVDSFEVLEWRSKILVVLGVLEDFSELFFKDGQLFWVFL